MIQVGTKERERECGQRNTIGQSKGNISAEWKEINEEWSREWEKNKAGEKK